MSQAKRLGYAEGVINGMLTAPLFGAPKARMQWLEQCTEGMTDFQVAEVIRQYIQQHPAEWHHQLHVLTYQALLDACPDSPLHAK
jgi:hypothetical protein